MSFTEFATGWLLINVGFAVASAFAASRWGRAPFGWLLLGTVLGPLAFAVLLGMRISDRRNQPSPLRGPARGVGAIETPKILLAVDGSASSMRAVQFVVERFAPDLGDVTLSGVLPIEQGEGVNAAEKSLRRMQLEEEVGRYLEAATASLHSAGISCKTVIRFGDPAEEIVGLAREIGSDLVVLGRRGSGTTRFLLGSVSEKVVKAAECDVSVIS